MYHIIKTEKIIGRGCGQYLSVIDISFRRPVYEIIKIIKKVKITDCYVVKNKVLLSGKLKKNIIYKTRNGFTSNGNVTKICGDVVHSTVEIPFSLFIEVPGARVGDKCYIKKAFVEGSREIERNFNFNNTFNLLHEKDIIRVDVQVTRSVDLCVKISRCCKPLPPKKCCGGPGIQSPTLGPCCYCGQG